MPTTVGQHAVATFTSPVNGTTPIDANTVRGNDNTIRTAYVTHDADPGIHVQSSTFSSRPVAGTAGRKWVTADAGSYKLWYDDGTRWHEIGNDAIDIEVVADEALAKGDVVSVTGYNNGLNLARVAKFTGSAPAFGIVAETIANGGRGYVVNTGILMDVNTQALGATGTILYPAATGTFTATKPVAGEYQVAAYVLRQNTNNGVLYVEFSAPRIVERSDNTVSTVVLRDASGNFSAGTVTASLTGNVTGNVTGNADTATKLSSARTFAVTGDVTGSVSSDLTSGASIATAIAAGVIVNADINASAGIVDTKLATISTAGKVANSATTATSANTASAIVARDTNGDFTARVITLTGGTRVPVRTETGNVTVAVTDTLILSNPASGTATITLPTAVGITGRSYTVKRIATASGARVVIATTSSQTIDGLLTWELFAVNARLVVMSDGTNWQVIDRYDVIPTDLTLFGYTVGDSLSSATFARTGDASYVERV